jgi:hypothetical protein
MVLWKRVLTLLGFGEHAEFIWSILDLFGLTKPINWLLYISGGGVGGYLARMEDWPPIVIFLVVIATGVGLSIVYGVLHFVWRKNEKINEKPAAIEVPAVAPPPQK